MAHHIIQGNAGALGVALIVQAGRNAPVALYQLAHRIVNGSGVPAFLHHAGSQVESRIVQNASLPDALDIRCILDDIPGRTHLPLKKIKFHCIQSLIIGEMTFLVLTPTAAPAQIISIHTEVASFQLHCGYYSLHAKNNSPSIIIKENRK